VLKNLPGQISGILKKQSLEIGELYVERVVDPETGENGGLILYCFFAQIERLLNCLGFCLH